MASTFPVSRWSLLALAAALIGGSATLGADQLMMLRWVGSGSHFPISERVEVEFDAGTHLIYYQSRESVPVEGHAQLYVFDLDGHASPVQPAPHLDSYRAHLSGWSGHGLWEVEIAEPGVYDLLCYNTSYPSDDHVPADDRIVIDKQPQSIDEVLQSSSRVRFGGAFFTIILVVALYIQHMRTVGRSEPAKAAIPDSQTPTPSDVDEQLEKSDQ